MARKNTAAAVNEQTALRRVTDLLALPGPTGGESAVAAYLTAALRKAGVAARQIVHDRAHKKSDLGGEVGNLIVKLPGTLKGPRRLLMAHMDTVPPCAGARPVKKGAKIVSRDAHTALGGDDRAGCAVVLTAALEILARKLPHPPLTLLWTVQEEGGLHGARHLDVGKLGKPALLFNFDGSDAFKYVVGATGACRMNISVHGLASHAGLAPQAGVSAVTVAALAVADLRKGGWLGAVRKGRRRGTSNIGRIEGGAATNVVTDRVNLTAEARSHEPAFRQQIAAAFKAAFTRAAKSVKSESGKRRRCDFEAIVRYEPFALRDDEPCVAQALEAIRAEGLTPLRRIADGGLDANWMIRHGLPTVTLGCGQRDIHTVKEWLDLPHYLAACRIGLRLATGTGCVGKV